LISNSSLTTQKLSVFLIKIEKDLKPKFPIRNPKFLIIIALTGGILMGLTPAPIEAWYLGWIALVPLWLLIVRSPYNFKQNVLIAIAWGFGYHGLALFWITGIHPMTWMGVPWLASLAIAIFCWLFITFWGIGLVVAWTAAMTFWARFRRKKAEFLAPIFNSLLRVLSGVALWCGLEAIWSSGSLWWTSLSFTQSPHNLLILQLSQLSGPSTVTASIVAVNGLTAEYLTRLIASRDKVNTVRSNSASHLLQEKTVRFTLLSLALLILISLHSIGFWLYSRPVSRGSNEALKVGIIQGNIRNEIKLYSDGWKQAIEGYTRGYKNLVDRGVNVVLTPETALPFFWEDLVKYRSSIYESILQNKVPAWIGAFGKKENSYTNSLFTITGDGKIFSEYDKTKLVPLGEYIPFEQFLGKIIDRLSPLDAHLAAGKSNQIFNTPWDKAIVGICYDSAFAEHFRRQAKNGGEFILTASNNAHYSKSMPAQHHAQDVMRAIETDRWAARATNTGYSAIVDPRGRTLWISEINIYQLRADTIYRRQTKTLYVRWGDWLTVSLLILTFCFFKRSLAVD
jgi:apolipoprotein N-acyltransferase